MTSPLLSSRSGSSQRLACEECRRRKLRCDGNQPQCSTCESAGTECNINTDRPSRGPKKGYLKALQSKIDILESRLRARDNEHLKWPDDRDNGSEISSAITSQPGATSTGFGTAESDAHYFAIASSLMSEHEPYLSTFADVSVVPTNTTLMPVHTPSTPSTEASSRSSILATDLMQAELDQLYFDRVHAAVPILHQRRYLSWSKSHPKTGSRTCLQFAMWAAASLMSAHFQHLQDVLYAEVKQMLSSTIQRNSGGSKTLAVNVELVQTWLLIATYEFIKKHHHEASISAGRAIRLAELMGLNKIDMTNNTSGPGQTDFITTEEKRRVFWMAFTLEGLYSMRNNLPLVVNEYYISTFLPAPDHDFQNGQQVKTGFLSDYIDKRSHVVKSPLNECIMLIITCARTLSLTQKYNMHCLYTQPELNHLDLRKRLDNILSVRLQTLAQDYPSSTNSSDPMLLFANFLAQASIIYLFKEIQFIEDRDTGARHGGLLVSEYQQRAFTAVERSIELARSLTDIPFFKINSFMPIPLFLCTEFLSLNRSNPATAPLLEKLLDIFGRLKEVDSPQQSYTSLLDLDQVYASLHG